MKKITLALLLMLSAFAWAKDVPKPADYTITVHVSGSRMVSERSHALYYVQSLDVVIDGKRYVLESEAVGALLALGDYKAKLVKDEHKGTYDSLQVYEFLFPDQKTRKFTVIGQTE